MDTHRKPGNSTVARYVRPPAARPLAAVALLVLSACTTAPRLAPIDKQSTVAFVVVSSPPAQGAATVRDTAMHDKSGSGVKIGATTGALLGFSCGPFAPLCVPGGAMLGGFSGAMAGGVVGIFKTLPKETVALLDDRLRRLQQSHDPMILLRTNVLDLARTRWEVTDNTSNSVVTLEVQGLSLTSASPDKIALVMQVLVRTAPGMATGSSARVTQKRFEFVSKESNLATWLDETGDVPEANLRNACQQLATEVVAELASG